MNRLVLIGNGFDLAHGLKTSYKDFFYWYWENRRDGFVNERSSVSEDVLCKLTCHKDASWHMLLTYDMDIKHGDGKEIFNHLVSNTDSFHLEFSPFFDRIRKCIETKGWVDIENEYYELLKRDVLEGKDVSEIEKLNHQLQYLQEKLIEYLKSIDISKKLIKKEIMRYIYMPFKSTEISIEGQRALKEHIESWMEKDDLVWDRKLYQYGYNFYSKGYVADYKERTEKIGFSLEDNNIPLELLLPNHIMLLNFNYTHTADLYCKEASIFSVNQIHGDLNNPMSVIFGYGDELDKDYKTILEKNENKFLCNIKSIKYLEAEKYRKMLSFIESEPYQVIIMGHSCGNSDRTLLNTLFEHRNCVSIKPYYYKRVEDDDNYTEIVQNISRNFKDMKLMRDRVVNKTYCEPLTKF